MQKHLMIILTAFLFSQFCFAKHSILQTKDGFTFICRVEQGLANMK